MTIHKYELSPTLTKFLPRGARVISVGVQRGRICLWAVVDPKEPLERRDFHIFGTGFTMPAHIAENGYFIGTVMMDGDTYVFHVFEDFLHDARVLEPLTMEAHAAAY